MVLDEQPVAHVVALAVDGQRLALERVQEHQRDQLLGEMERAIVVGAVGDHDGQAVGVAPGPRQVVGRRLGGRIGRARVVGRGLVERAGLAERAEHLVGRDVEEAEAFAARRVQACPVRPRRLQQDEGAGDVGVDEGRGAGDRAVDVALGREVRDRIGRERLHGAGHRRRIGDVGLQEGEARPAFAGARFRRSPA